MAKKILIVGGCLAGTIIANGLCRQLGKELRANEVTITVIGDNEQHLYQPGLLYVPFGRIREKDLFRDQRSVLDRRVIFHRWRRNPAPLTHTIIWCWQPVRTYAPIRSLG